MGRRTRLNTEAREEGSYVIKCVFKDESGSSVDPASLFWKLTDTDGNIINSRDWAEVSGPLSTTYIPLTGDDLSIIGDGSQEVRVVTIKGTFYSTLTTSTLDFTDDCQFNVRNLVGIT